MVNTAEQLVSSSLNYFVITNEVIENARVVFDEYKKAGIIKSLSSFDDSVWYTTNEYSNVGLYFDISPFHYKKYKDIFRISLSDFILYIKSYITVILEKNVLVTINNFLLDVRHIICTHPDEIYGTTKKIRLNLPHMCSDFFSMLPTAEDNEKIEELILAMDSYAELNILSSHHCKRTLADFDSYFIFNDIINDYWESELTTEDRLFYYPLYLWWHFTGVIPLRPREFLLTSRNCLSTDKDNNYYLSVRRNMLKGGKNKVSHKINDDYSFFTCKISEHLYLAVQKYIELTTSFDNTEINTLFVTDPHYRKWKQKKHSDSRFLTYVNMNTILKYFYREIIHEKYGYQITFNISDRHLEDHEIGYIHLGDTRHLALINIIQEGGSPVTAMLLAGHTNDIMASHYYSNIENLIECKTYRQYRKMIGGTVEYQISMPSSLPKIYEPIELSNGNCFSIDYRNGGISDCLKAIGDNSEIGYCPNCQYYRPNKTSYFSADDIYKRKIQDDCIALKDAISLVRQQKGNLEDIGEILLKLNSSSVSYSQFLMEKYMNGGN